MSVMGEHWDGPGFGEIRAELLRHPWADVGDEVMIQARYDTDETVRWTDVRLVVRHLPLAPLNSGPNQAIDTVAGTVAGYIAEGCQVWVWLGNGEDARDAIAFAPYRTVAVAE